MSDLSLPSVTGSALNQSQFETNHKQAAQAKTADYTIAVTDNRDTIEFDGSSLTATLPAASATASASDTGDFIVTIINNNASALTIAPNGADSLQVTSLGQYQAVTLKINQASDGWNAISENLGISSDLNVATLTASGLITATGGQIAFPATQEASSDPNTLDDYEEGTFTPAIWDLSHSDSESQTYSTQTGNYTKIGNRVFFDIVLYVTSLGTLTTSQTALIGNLPFTSATPHVTTFTVGAFNMSITAGYSVFGIVPASANYINLYLYDDSGGATGLLLSEFTGTGQVWVSGSYRV